MESLNICQNHCIRMWSFKDLWLQQKAETFTSVSVPDPKTTQS